jgi:predicted small secreted protein
MVRKVIGILMLSSVMMAATACNTVRGAAEDVESVANGADRAT